MSSDGTARLAQVRALLTERDAAALVSISPATQTHLCGFRALLYSRPIALFVDAARTTLVVPGLEEAHARSEAKVDEVLVYYEHPEAGGGSNREPLTQLLARLPSGATVGVEAGTMPYALATSIGESGFRLVDLDADLAQLRSRKDAAEIALMRTAARIVGRGVRASVAACRAGTTELEIDGAGTAAVLEAASEVEGAPTVEQLLMTPSGPERTTLPHVFSTTRRLQPGDGVIHTRQVGLKGYRAELERTLFVGKPSDRQRRLFDVMRRAQEAAIAATRPGVRCRDVDVAARSVISDAGLSDYAIHRTGHGIGLLPHEPPYLRFDSDDVLEEGMAITVEPGIYVPGVGGFRHSDTALVTTGGCELLTSFPTDVDSLSVAAGQ